MPPTQDKPVLTQAQQARAVTATCFTAERGCRVGGREWRPGEVLSNNSGRFHPDPFCTYPRSQNDARELPPATETFLAHHGPAAAAALLFAIVSRRESS